MKTTELIAKLQQAVDEHGDLDFWVNDDGYGYEFESLVVEDITYSKEVRGLGPGYAFTEWLHWEPIETRSKVISMRTDA